MLRSFVISTAFGLSFGVAAQAKGACTENRRVVQPAQASVSLFQLRSPDDVCLQGYEWRPAALPPRGVFVVAHGLRDHANRYAELVDALVAQGFVVQAQDMRGHGASGGERQRFDTVEVLVADLGLAIERAAAAHPALPVFLFGHSLGGLVSTRYALGAPTALTGLVLSAPLLVVPSAAKRWELALVRAIAAVAPGAHVQQIDDEQFLREGAARRALLADPLVDRRKLPAASARAALDALHVLQPQMAQLAVPLLVLHGEADAATDVAGSRELVRLAASRDKALHVVPLARHDLINEPEGPALARTIASWAAQRLGSRL